MNKLFNLTSTFKAAEADDGSVMIRGMASTADFDRAGDSISAEAWTKGGLANFEKNPIILFNHDYDKPIGRATGLKAGPNGLELECKISKAAPANVAQLVKDGVLGAFSVGFRVKDADYLKETDGLMIKDAELFEVSVVSVPCNQAATFSLAKSFDSQDEYNEFKKTFTNRVDLAGQSLAKDEDTSSNIASDHTPKSADIVSADQEIKMDNQNIDLEAFAKQVAEDTAAKIAMKQAEQKAAEEAQAKAAQAADEAKALEAQSIKSTVSNGIESGVEKLMGDVEAKLAEKDAKIEEVIGTFSAELEEKKAEIEAMRDSKRTFADRSGAGDMTKWGRDFLQAHILGKVTGKGFETDYAKSIMEKAGIVYAGSGNAPDIDQEVATQIEKEVREELRAAALFREIGVNSTATVLPIQPDASTAVWQQGATSAGNLNSNTGGSADTGFTAQQVILKAYRLISQTHMDNNIDEEVLVNLLPMLTDSVARAHAKSVESMVVNGVGSGGSATDGPRGGAEQILGLSDHGEETVGGVIDLGTPAGKDAAVLTAEHLVQARKGMGKYGINPSDVAYVVGQSVYFDLLEDSGFQDLNEVGPMATKLTGQVGAVFGSPVIVTPELTGANGAIAAMAVNTSNYVIPRLRGVSVESDYSVVNQRQDIVATQSLGFSQLVDGYTNNQPCVKLTTKTS